MSKAKRPIGQGWALLGNVKFYLEPGAPAAKLIDFDWTDGVREKLVAVDLDHNKTDYWGRYYCVLPINEAKRLVSELDAAIKEAEA